jgi:uncharacterized membrane protein
MEPLSTILLARVIGVFLILIGAMLLARRPYFLSVFTEFVRQRLVRTVISMAEVLGALCIVLGHNVWSPLPAAIVTFIGWAALAEGCAYLFLPDPVLDRFIRTFNTPGWYVVGAFLAIATGSYLACYGFGVFAV